MTTNMHERSRRTFMSELVLSSGALMFRGGADQLMAQTTPNWENQIGLELFTVRDLLRQDYEGVLAKLAKIGYKEVEPADPYNSMEPKAYKALSDKYGAIVSEGLRSWPWAKATLTSRRFSPTPRSPG